MHISSEVGFNYVKLSNLRPFFYCSMENRFGIWASLNISGSLTVCNFMSAILAAILDFTKNVKGLSWTPSLCSEIIQLSLVAAWYSDRTVCREIKG